MGAGNESEPLLSCFKYSKGWQKRYPPGDREQGHKSLHLEAGAADSSRKPSRSLEIPEEDRQPKVPSSNGPKVADSHGRQKSLKPRRPC